MNLRKNEILAAISFGLLFTLPGMFTEWVLNTYGRPYSWFAVIFSMIFVIPTFIIFINYFTPSNGMNYTQLRHDESSKGEPTNG